MKKSEAELIKKLIKDEEYSIYFKFFVGKLHFLPKIVGKKNKKILAFVPYPVTYDNGSTSSWTTFDTRYERDMWGSERDIKIEFDSVKIIPHNPMVLLRNGNVIAKISQRVLASARIMVISKTVYDKHSYAVLYLQPTNSYTYAEFKDNEHISRIRKFSYGDLERIKSASELKYFMEHESPVDVVEIKGE